MVLEYDYKWCPGENCWSCAKGNKVRSLKGIKVLFCMFRSCCEANSAWWFSENVNLIKYVYIMEFELRWFKFTFWVMGLVFCIIIILSMDYETKDGMNVVCLSLLYHGG